MNDVIIIDYGLGNVLSVQRGFEYMGAHSVLTDSPELVRNAKALVLPGVGAFGDGMEELDRRKLVEPIKGFAASGRPLLGICLGLQMMMDWSEEFGFHKGLGLVAGGVVKISEKDIEGKKQRIPHIGWNAIADGTGRDTFDDGILRGIRQGLKFYFVHSYAPVPENEGDRLADTSYGGIKIAAVIRKGNVYGCQFHPEKSGTCGLRVIKNFLDLV